MVESSVGLSAPLSVCSVRSFTRTNPSARKFVSVLFGLRKFPSRCVPNQEWSRSGTTQRLGSWNARTIVPSSSRFEFQQVRLPAESRLHVKPSTHWLSLREHAPFPFRYGLPDAYARAPK